jgi:nicotinate-nucleotide adenylyltransferase
MTATRINTTAGPIGIFGGAFDPVHFGHLRTGFELLTTLRLARLHWVPTGEPRHRDHAIASAALRVKMLQAAVAGEPRFVVDTREVTRRGPSYSLDTLLEFRAEWPQNPLCLILGMDAFLGLPLWHRWQELLSLAHLIVAHRPGWQPPEHGPLAALLAEHRVIAPEALQVSLHGRIYVHAVTALDIASSELRRIVLAGEDPRFLVPEPVRDIILESQCYARATDLGEVHHS